MRKRCARGMERQGEAKRVRETKRESQSQIGKERDKGGTRVRNRLGNTKPSHRRLIYEQPCIFLH